jgi:hypothetical protein
VIASVSHLCPNSDSCIGSYFYIFSPMNNLARLAVVTVLAITGLGLAHVTIATPAHAQVGGYATHGHGGGGRHGLRCWVDSRYSRIVVPPKSWRVSYAASGLVLDSLIS